MSRKMTPVDELLNETIFYGGVPLRRCDVFKLATKHLGRHANGPFGADYFAFRPGKAPDDVEPWTVERYEEMARLGGWVSHYED